MWRAYVYPSEGRSYTLHLGIPEDGDVTLADVVGEVVPEGIVTKGDPGEPGEPGRDGQDGQDGHTPEITFDGTTIVVDGVPGPDLKGEPGEGGGGIAGAVPIFATLAEAQAWEAENPGKVALTLEGQEPVGPVDWEATAPSFNVATGEVTIPDDEGATYLMDAAPTAAGTYPVEVPSTVTVTAVAREGYTLVGQTEWVQQFEENITEYEGVALGYRPQLYYRMDDTSGVPVNRGIGGVSAQMTGKPTYGAPGVGGFPRSINTSSSSLFLSGLPPAGTTAYTYASIIRLESTTGGNIFSDFAGKNQARLAPGLVWTGWGPTASLGALASGLQVGDAHHVALTWDGALVRLYVDGVVVKEVADTGPLVGAPALKVSEGAFSTNGVIIDHTYALTASEVQALSDAVVR